MTNYDFNDAETQRNFDVIPDGTIATVRMTVRPGSVGDDGWLRRSKDGNSEALDCEFVVRDGPFAKRKFWSLLTVAGSTPGHAEAAKISAGKLRAILESARGIKPDDKSDAAKEARRIKSYGDFNGLTFVARIGVEPPQNGYKEKNRLDHVVTPDEKAWKPVTQEPAAAPSAAPAKPASTPAKLERPQWAS
ncbi:MAG TPA: hypothetical protein VH684_04755 [Xanthobacteraceae bacterium]|jgi:hypothetical protein